MLSDFLKNISSLSAVELLIAARYPISNISAEDLHQQLSGSSQHSYIVFDVREEEEYNMSHIASAIHVDPKTNEAEFLSTFSNRIADKNLVFYCSVGERSSLFIERVQEACKKSAAASVSNLRGGIFRWYNEGFPVVNASGTTNEIHPFNALWGTLVEKRPNK